MSCLTSETCTRDEFIYLFKKKKVPPFFFTNLALTFDYLDFNKDGAISAKDIALSLNVPLEKAQEIIMCIDDDNNGLFDYKEFCEKSEQFKALLLGMGQSLRESKEKRLALVNAFRRFDEGGKGLVDHLNFRYILRTMGEVMTPEEFDDLISHAPMTDEGQIYYHKLIDYLVDPCERKEGEDKFMDSSEELKKYFDHVLYKSKDGYRLAYRIKKFDPHLEASNFNKCYKHLIDRFNLRHPGAEMSPAAALEFAEIVKAARLKIPKNQPAYNKQQFLNYRGDKSLPISPRYFNRSCDISPVRTPTEPTKNIKASNFAYRHFLFPKQSSSYSCKVRHPSSKCQYNRKPSCTSTLTKTTMDSESDERNSEEAQSWLIVSGSAQKTQHTNSSRSISTKRTKDPKEEDVSVAIVELEYPGGRDIEERLTDEHADEKNLDEHSEDHQPEADKHLDRKQGQMGSEGASNVGGINSEELQEKVEGKYLEVEESLGERSQDIENISNKSMDESSAEKVVRKIVVDQDQISSANSKESPKKGSLLNNIASYVSQLIPSFFHGEESKRSVTAQAGDASRDAGEQIDQSTSAISQATKSVASKASVGNSELTNKGVQASIEGI